MAGLFKPNALLAQSLQERVLVRNVTGSSNSPCGCCDSWLDHYRGAAIGLPPRFCSAVGCSNVATVGGHIIVVRSMDRTWHIVPLCRSCNGLGRAYDISGHVQLVPAKPLPACAR